MNRPGARFCSGCGVARAVRCARCGTELTPSARFCDACGAAVAVNRAPLEAVRRTVSVVFSDLEDSTAMQETLDPESVRQIMARYYEVMRAAVNTHEGHIEKFIGDAVVAVFGSPVMREDDALRAVRCAATMAAGLRELNGELERRWGTRLASRTGVNTGELVVNAEGILVGDMMNTAARLEQAAPTGEVLIGESTRRLVRNHVTVEEVAPLELKGKASPVRAWRLVAATAAAAPEESPQEAPLVGRGAELRRLHAALDEVIANGACRLVTIVGSPGLGKSRLAEEFTREAGSVALVLRARCEPSGEGNALLPVAEVIRDASGIGEADPSELAREKLRALAPADDPDRERLVERVAGVLGIAEPASAQETFWALRRGLEELARRRPLVVVLDDLHWAAPMLLDLLEHLVEWIAGAPVLLLALARPELREMRDTLTAIGRQAVDVIELEPLDSDESRTLLDGLLGPADLPAGLLVRMLATTDGNPLFLGELVRMLVDEGALVREGAGWAVADGVDSFEVPPTIHALLSARIERLRTDERAVVERAAVIGQQFYRGAVAELLGPPARTDIDGHLVALRRKELIEPEGLYWIDEPVYRFHHVLIRDAAYRLLLKEVRAALHERFADWLADKVGESVGEYEEVIAFHLEQAHSYRRELGPLDEAGRTLGARAAEHLLTAGRRALAREDLAAAENLLSRALACDGGNELEILWELAETVLSAGDAARGAEVVGCYRAAVGSDRVGAARATVIEAQLANLKAGDDPAGSAEAVAQAAGELRDLADGRGEAKAWAVVAQTNARLGRVALVEKALDRALTAARAVEDRRRTTAVLAAAPRAALWGPSSVVRASGRCLDVVRILRMTPGSRHVEAFAIRCQAVLEAMRGRPDAARSILAGARSTLEELGLSLELAETRVHAGMVDLLAGEPQKAVEHLREALDGFGSLGAEAAGAHAAALLARALVARGGLDDIQAALAQAEFAEQHGGEDLRTAIIAASARGEALARTGEDEPALASARRAVALAEPTDALADKADASMALARVLFAAGRDDEAVAATQAAHACYEAKGHTVGMKAAAALAGSAVAPRAAAASAAGIGAEVLGFRPSERLVAEFIRCANARDFDALSSLLAEDCYIRDTRPLGWDELRGRAACLEAIRSPLETGPHVRIDIDEVLAGDDRVLVLREAWRGRGLKAGELEVQVGSVNLVENGQWIGVEFFDADDVDGMLARFAELSANRGRGLGESSLERAYASYMTRIATHDVDAILELFADGHVLREHRTISVKARTGKADLGALFESWFAAAPDLRCEVDEVLACDERVIALRVVYRGHARDGGGVVENWLGLVVMADDRGLWVSTDQFESEDVAGMLQCFAALGGERGVLGETRSERIAAEHARRVAAGDLDLIVAQFHEDYVARDQRTTVSQEPVRGHAAVRAMFGQALAMTGNLRWDVDEVLSASDRVIAMRVAYRGRIEGGGEAEVLAGHVTTNDGELLLSTDGYDYHDDAGMLARYAELVSHPVSQPPVRPPERFYAEYGRRWAAGDPDAIAALAAEDWVQHDHREISVWGTVRRDELGDWLRGALLGVGDPRHEVLEVLACDDQVIAFRALYGGIGHRGVEYEIETGVVAVVRDGLAVSEDNYDPDDHQGMIARYVELGGGLSVLGDAPVERFVARFIQHYTARDLETLLALTAEDFRWTDHRQLSWEPIRGREGLAALLKSSWEGTLDQRIEVDEVLACNAQAIAARFRWAGHNVRGGEFELPAGQVIVCRDGLYRSIDQYDADAREAMLARFTELTEAPTPRAPDGPAEHAAGLPAG